MVSSVIAKSSEGVRLDIMSPFFFGTYLLNSSMLMSVFIVVCVKVKQKRAGEELT
jgi:hypothetical protein